MTQRAIWHCPKEWLSRRWEFALIQWISDKGHLISEQWSNGCTKTTEKQACQISHVHFDGIAHLIEVTSNILFPWANAISADLFVDRVIIKDGSWQPSMLSGVLIYRLSGFWCHTSRCAKDWNRFKFFYFLFFPTVLWGKRRRSTPPRCFTNQPG